MTYRKLFITPTPKSFLLINMSTSDFQQGDSEDKSSTSTDFRVALKTLTSTHRKNKIIMTCDNFWFTLLSVDF